MQIAQQLKENFRGRTLTEKACYILILTLVLQAVSPYLFINKAYGAQLTEASIRLSRMSASVAASSTDPILVVVKPASTATEGKVKITWPTSSAFTVNATNTNHTVTTTGIPSTYQGETLTAWPTIAGGASAAVTGGEVVFTSGDLTPGTLYGFYITGGITNPATANAGPHTVSIATQTAGNVDIDTADTKVDITTTNSDQVTLYATVSATFNFALSGNSINMAALSTTARATGNITADIDTNANNGWSAWMRSEGGAATLASATSGDSISSTNTGSCVTATIGSKGYVVDVNSTGGTGTGTLSVATEYDCTDGQAGGVIGTTHEEIAYRNGPVDSDTLTLNAVVTISAVTEAAADYTDTWEVVGAGNF